MLGSSAQRLCRNQAAGALARLPSPYSQPRLVQPIDHD